MPRRQLRPGGVPAGRSRRACATQSRLAQAGMRALPRVAGGVRARAAASGALRCVRSQLSAACGVALYKTSLGALGCVDHPVPPMDMLHLYRDIYIAILARRLTSAGIRSAAAAITSRRYNRLPNLINHSIVCSVRRVRVYNVRVLRRWGPQGSSTAPVRPCNAPPPPATAARGRTHSCSRR